jgi:hypothetical protein
MTLMIPHVNDLDDETRTAVDLLVPPPASEATARRRWLAVLAAALVVLIAWQTGTIRPILDTDLSGQGAQWNTRTGIMELDVLLRNRSLSPVDIDAIELDPRWGTIVSVQTTDRQQLPARASRDELVGMHVTVQLPLDDCLALGSMPPQVRADGLLTVEASVAWLPLEHSIRTPTVDDLIVSAMQTICSPG